MAQKEENVGEVLRLLRIAFDLSIFGLAEKNRNLEILFVRSGKRYENAIRGNIGKISYRSKYFVECVCGIAQEMYQKGSVISETVNGNPAAVLEKHRTRRMILSPKIRTFRAKIRSGIQTILPKSLF